MLFYQLKIFIGGLPVEDDIQVLKNGECKIAVGTVGRLISLIKQEKLNLSDLKLLILDEADNLLNKKSFGDDIKQWVFQKIDQN